MGHEPRRDNKTVVSESQSATQLRMVVVPSWTSRYKQRRARYVSKDVKCAYELRQRPASAIFKEEVQEIKATPSRTLTIPIFSPASRLANSYRLCIRFPSSNCNAPEEVSSDSSQRKKSTCSPLTSLNVDTTRPRSSSPQEESLVCKKVRAHCSSKSSTLEPVIETFQNHLYEPLYLNI